MQKIFSRNFEKTPPKNALPFQTSEGVNSEPRKGQPFHLYFDNWTNHSLRLYFWWFYPPYKKGNPSGLPFVMLKNLEIKTKNHYNIWTQIIDLHKRIRKLQMRFLWFMGYKLTQWCFLYFFAFANTLLKGRQKTTKN